MNLIGRPRDSICTFRTVSRAGVWFVTKDEVFYGDYLSKAQALRGACLGAQGVEAAGGSARVLTASGEGVFAHRDFQFIR